MEFISMNLMEQKRDELIIQLLEEGYTSKELSIIFNKHILDVEKILEINGYGLVLDK